MPVSAHRRTLSADEIRRAILIDFEGNKDRAPTVLGVLYTNDDGADTVEQLVLEPSFHGAVGEGGATAAVHVIRAARDLVRRANRERRLIVSWSQHDRDKLLGALGDRALAARVTALHRNAIVTARRWARTQDVSFDANSLDAYMRFVGYEVPEAHGPGRTGETLRALRKSLAANGNEWATLTPGARARFRDLLGHNRDDLYGMRAVLERATATPAG